MTYQHTSDLHPQTNINSRLTVGFQIPSRQDVPHNLLRQVSQVCFEIIYVIVHNTKWIRYLQYLIIERMALKKTVVLQIHKYM